MSAKPQIFISYNSEDGMHFARALNQWLKEENLEVRPWIDREQMEGGGKRWKQIEGAIDSAKFLVLVMTPAAMQSEVTRKEWRYAQQQGVVVYPVKGAPDRQLDFAALPDWMRKSHFFDLEHEWKTFVHSLRSEHDVADLPTAFVQPPREPNFKYLLRDVFLPERKVKPQTNWAG